MNPTILFFSRGKGRGHAVPDAAIADRIRLLDPSATIRFVSYSAGAAALRDRGHECVDLGFGDDPSPWDILRAVSRILAETCPELVVIHEEFALPPVVKGFGCRCLFITDWFPPINSLPTAALRFVDEILFLDEPGRCDVPPDLWSRTLYFGVVLRDLGAAKTTRLQARAAKGIPADAVVVLMAPGGSQIHSEKSAPLAELVLGAFERMQTSGRPRRLLWVAGGSDHEMLSKAAATRRDVSVLHPHQGFTETLLCADIVVTKGNRLPLFECEVLGIRSVSISHGLNPVDDSRTAQIPTNTALRARGLDSIILANYLDRLLRLNPGSPMDLRNVAGRTEMVAQRILHHLAEVRAPAAALKLG